MNKNTVLFIIFVAFVILVLAGQRCFGGIIIKSIDYGNKDKLSYRIITICNKCTILVNELDALLVKYAREARINVEIINSKGQIVFAKNNKKHFAGPVTDLLISKSEAEALKWYKKLKKAIDVRNKAELLLTGMKKNSGCSNKYYYWLVKDLISRGLYRSSHNTLLRMLVQDKITLGANVEYMEKKLCSLLKEKEEIKSDK